MHTFKDSVTAKTWMVTYALLVIACMFCVSNSASAQKQTGKTKLKVKLGDIDSSSAPLRKILDNPVLTANEKGCEVTKFSISILPSGGELQGPYTRTGSRIGPNQLSMLSEFTNVKVRIFIDDVYVKCKGKDTVKVPGINLLSHP